MAPASIRGRSVAVVAAALAGAVQDLDPGAAQDLDPDAVLGLVQAPDRGPAWAPVRVSARGRAGAAGDRVAAVPAPAAVAEAGTVRILVGR